MCCLFSADDLQSDFSMWDKGIHASLFSDDDDIVSSRGNYYFGHHFGHFLIIQLQYKIIDRPLNK